MQVRLTTKFTLTVALLVLAVVTVLSFLYVSILASQLIKGVEDRAAFVAKMVFLQAQNALRDAAQEGSAPASSNPEDIREYVRRTLAENQGLTSQVDAAVGYSNFIFEISIVDSSGRVLISSDSSLPGQIASRRNSLEQLARGGPRKQLSAILGRLRTDEVTYPFNLGDQPFGEIRVATQVGLLRQELLAGLLAAGSIAVVAVLLSTLLGALVSRATLAPLRRISKQLDQIATGRFDPEPESGGTATRRGDEFGQMSTSITQIGQQISRTREEIALDILIQARSEENQRRKVLEETLANAAHEVRNPLHSMQLWLEVLRGNLPREQETPANAVKVLQSEIERLNRVVSQALDYMRPVVPQFEETKMEKLVGEVLEVLRPQLQRARIELATQWNGELPAVRVDRKLIQEAVRNLVLNAVKAMPQGGQLMVALERRGEMLRLTVSDTGCGIPAEHYDKIFALFFTKFKERGGGSGIGLASAYKTVQFHNGSINFESEEGRGTTFRIELPLAN